MNPRQKRFVEEYLVSLNAKQSAIAAGYSEKNAHIRGSKLLDVPEVKEAIARAMGARSARTRISQDRVLEELSVLAYSNIHNYVIDEDGNVALRDESKPEHMRAVSSIKRKRRVIPQEDGDPIVEVDVEIRLWDKPAALKMSGQHLGMFNDREPAISPVDVARAVREAVKAMDDADGLDAAA